MTSTLLHYIPLSAIPARGRSASAFSDKQKPDQHNNHQSRSASAKHMTIVLFMKQPKFTAAVHPNNWFGQEYISDISFGAKHVSPTVYKYA